MLEGTVSPSSPRAVSPNGMTWAGREWAMYVAGEGRAVLRTLKLGQRTGQEAEVQEGLSEGEQVILHPGDTLTNGARIAVSPAT
jgi:multidrug efflux pump subunit AcrA (membrane-fusion protein)